MLANTNFGVYSHFRTLRYLPCSYIHLPCSDIRHFALWLNIEDYHEKIMYVYIRAVCVMYVYIRAVHDFFSIAKLKSREIKYE